MQTWKFSDRTEWAEGPWDNEPIDKAVWTDEATGLDCMIHRAGGGAWCGYVGIPKEHKLFGEDYNKHYNLNVHGGLTFSAGCTGMEDNGRGICHPADEGDHVWWFGFDCGHSFDIHPRKDLSFMHSKHVDVFGQACEYRDKEYVIFEVARLAKQLAEAR